MLRSWNEWHILSDLQWNAFAFGIFAFVRSGNKLHANVTTDCSGLLSLPAVWRFFTASFCPTSGGRGPLSATPLRWRRRMMQRWGEATLGDSREGILMRSFGLVQISDEDGSKQRTLFDHFDERQCNGRQQRTEVETNVHDESSGRRTGTGCGIIR